MNSNFTLLLTSSGQDWHFHIPTDMKWSGIVNFLLLLISSGQKNDNSTYLLTSNGYEWQFHITTDI